MRILMSIQSLVAGGAERFFVNLANGLAERHQVTCYLPLKRLGDSVLTSALAPGLRVHEQSVFTPLTYRIFYKLTLMLRHRLPAFDPEGMLHAMTLHALHRRHMFDVVNAHLMPAARQACSAFEQVRLPVTKTDHGDTAHADMCRDGVIFRRLDALICPAAANREKARALPFSSRCRITRIAHGHRVSSAASVLPPFEGVTFGMVARGVADKGWHEAVAAARVVRERTGRALRLVLVGDGPALAHLRDETQAEPWIVHAGHQQDAAAWIRGFDVGLLPSCLVEESLPLSVIEYLLCGRPVIATAVGGIPEMLGDAGLLVPLAADRRAEVGALARAMMEMMDSGRREWLAARVPQAASAFDLGRCVDAYEELFRTLTRLSA
jgi:glycosyltransferase involved in cell wall biosynthesis